MMAFFNLLLLCFSVVLALAVDVSYERQATAAAPMCPQRCRCGTTRPQTSAAAAAVGGSGQKDSSGSVSEEQLAVNCSGMNLTSIPFTIEDSRAGN